MRMFKNIPMNIKMRPIGFIKSPFKSVNGMPIQTVAAPHTDGQLHVLQEFMPALQGVDGFEYLILVTYLHQANEKLEVIPFMDDCSHGAFATRSPARPNRIGLSIVKLIDISDTVMNFKDNDMLDGTPVLDVKPYVPKLDVRETKKIGWYQKGLLKLHSRLSDDHLQ